MKNKLENIKEKISHVQLSSAEKFDMLQNLRGYADSRITSPFYNQVWFKRSFAYVTAFVLIIGTGATSFAAEYALPGDILYSVKTGVNEAVIQTLPLPTSTKAKVEIGLIDRRMSELEKMIVTNQDTPEKVSLVLKKIDEHKDQLDARVGELNTDQNNKVQVASIHAELDTVVDAHLDVLAQITHDDTDSDEVVATTTPQDSEDTPSETEAPTTSTDVPDADQDQTITPADDEDVDPVIEEVSDFSEEEVKPLLNESANSTSTIDIQTRQQIRTNLRSRIFKKAQESLKIKLNASTSDDDSQQ